MGSIGAPRNGAAAVLVHLSKQKLVTLSKNVGHKRFYSEILSTSMACKREKPSIATKVLRFPSTVLIPAIRQLQPYERKSCENTAPHQSKSCQASGGCNSLGVWG